MQCVAQNIARIDRPFTPGGTWLPRARTFLFVQVGRAVFCHHLSMQSQDWFVISSSKWAHAVANHLQWISGESPAFWTISNCELQSPPAVVNLLQVEQQSSRWATCAHPGARAAPSKLPGSSQGITSSLLPWPTASALEMQPRSHIPQCLYNLNLFLPYVDFKYNGSPILVLLLFACTENPAF